ncbi:hypothetical protein XNC1_2600 [Xenorhabdus nematophila ATCC 19061]|uniref:Uncharacterized protein n=1 Tax=Xenorhabdus nematophila (strain ATCC 19061 / DSM 3370 / CCUG 14189 / LMG 1036 / NCIMB 9965 / AN6) TaxID=406817 RepID=D3VHL0_XENNA|nr:hypothetical protein XNC1_2600 [Xenorhabdus nematophila ATCC 19061]CEK23493.1 hypothetical protein XNC2_2499 [Xenorhabdus nematophila AN6/1]
MVILVNFPARSAHRSRRRRRACREQSGTQEILMLLKGMSISGTSAKTQGLRNGYQEVGVSHSSDETSNDRGAKGGQTDRT